MSQLAKARRLIRLYQLLLSREVWTISGLAERLDCSRRTIFRDLNELQEVGIGMERDAQYGIRLLDRAALRPINFRREELLALHVMAEASALRTVEPFRETLESALERIRAASDPAQRDLVLRLGGRVSFGPKDTSASGPEKSVRRTIDRAIREQRRLRVRYRSVYERALIELDLEPYGQTFRRHSWYVVGRDLRAGEERVFRLDRFERAELLPERFMVRPDFSIDGFFRDSWEVFVGPPQEVRIRIAAALRPILEGSEQHPSQKLEVAEDGSVLLRVTVAGLEEIERWVLSFGGDAEVLHPPELRERIRHEAKRLLQMYGPQGVESESRPGLPPV